MSPPGTSAGARGATASRSNGRSRIREIRALLWRRTLIAVPSTLAITAAVFALASVAPFNPLAVYLGSRYEHATPAERAVLARELGLDDSWYTVWARWFADALRGDWGVSRLYNQPVAEVVAERLPMTALLTGLGLAAAIALAVVLALAAGRRPGGTLDRATLVLVHVAQAVPPFVLGLAAIAVFALGLGLPAGGAAPGGSDPTVRSLAVHLILPVGVLALTLLPWLVLVLRASVIEALNGDAVLAARGRGLRETTILRSHVLPVALLPFMTVIGSRLGELVTGALLVEAVFSWPGLASATIASAVAGDFPLLAAVTAMTCLAVFAGSTLADVSYVLADPRVRDV